MNTAGREAAGASQKVYDAGEAIDALLDADDGKLLGAIAYYRTTVMSVFGREGLTELLRRCVDEAPSVTYFSKRSRAEIDPGRPTVNLRVDDAAALALHPELARGARARGLAPPDFGFSPPRGGAAARPEDKELSKIILDLKSSVIFAEVCSPMTNHMNNALAPHWVKGKKYLEGLGADPELLRLFVGNFFAVTVAQDAGTHPRDRMAQLRFLAS